MSDLISRSEAIKTVKFYESFCDPYPRVIESLENLPSAQPNNECEKCVFSPFKQFRQTAQLEQRWIPCSERLPEKYVEVLVSVNYKYKGEPQERYTDIGSLTEKGWAFVWDVYHRLNEFNEVIAWMPLPDAYEAEK